MGFELWLAILSFWDVLVTRETLFWIYEKSYVFSFDFDKWQEGMVGWVILLSTCHYFYFWEILIYSKSKIFLFDLFVVCHIIISPPLFCKPLTFIGYMYLLNHHIRISLFLFSFFFGSWNECYAMKSWKNLFVVIYCCRFCKC